MMAMLFNNPIAAAQLRAKGGWKMLSIVTVGYGLLLAATVFITIQMDDQVAQRTARAWLSGLLGIEMALLLLVGTAQIGSAIRSDMNNRLIESHRLMPMPAAHGVAGYLQGPPIFVIAMSVATFIIGMALAPMATVTASWWILAHVVIVFFTLLVWILLAFTAFVTKGGSGLVWILISVSMFGSAYAIMLLPGVLVLATPIHGRTIFDMQYAEFRLDPITIISITAQLAISAIFFVGMMRRYRGQSGPALPVGLGIALVAAWTVLSVGGMAKWNEFAPLRARFDRDLFEPQLIASMAFAMLLAIAPLTGSAFLAQVRRARGYSIMQLPTTPPAVACVGCTMLIAIIPAAFWLAAPLGMPLRSVWTPSQQTVIVVLAFCTGVTYLARWAYLAVPRAAALVTWWIVITWLMPVLADLIYLATQNIETRSFGSIATISPPASLLFIWRGELEIDPRMGMAIQCLMAAVPVIAYHVGARSRRVALPVPA